MEERWIRIIVAVVLSLWLPELVVLVGSRMYTPKIDPTPPTESTTISVLATIPTSQPQQTTISVLKADDCVIQMELEEYIRGVVLAEMSAYFGEEALKAQSIAARTYTMRRITLGDKHPNGAICTYSGCCQAWLSDEQYLAERGTQKLWQKIADAVTQTAGLIVTYHGKPAETTYYSCSGGRTESALAVWNSDIPYLISVESPGEEWATVFAQEFYFSKEAFASALERSLSGDPVNWLGKVSYTDGGGVATMELAGICYSGKELRKRLHLPSTIFTMTADETGIYITTRGNGHRVGMSQYGADAMADSGYTYEEILQHYYPGTRIDKIGNIG